MVQRLFAVLLDFLRIRFKISIIVTKNPIYSLAEYSPNTQFYRQKMEFGRKNF